MGRRLFKELERAYGFDEVAIVPGQVTINPDLTSTKMTIADLALEIPVLASAMDGAVSPRIGVIRLERFSLERSRKGPDGHPKTATIIDLVLNLKGGVTTVLGATSSQDSRQALFVSVTATAQEP